MPQRDGFVWIVPPDQALPQLMANYTKYLFLGGRNVAPKIAEEMQAWAKANAIWQDQSGDARALFRAYAKDSPGVLAEIVLTHGVDYGLWLEIAHAGKYAIIPKTIDQFGPRIAKGLQGIVNLGLATRGD
jgi:hypothetical protein